MVGRIILAIGAVCFVAFVVVVVIHGSPWAPRPAAQPAAPVIAQTPQSARKAAEDEALRRYVAPQPVPLTGYKQW
jgi:hypothetical protein